MSAAEKALLDAEMSAKSAMTTHALRSAERVEAAERALNEAQEKAQRESEERARSEAEDAVRKEVLEKARSEKD